jgi:DNA repair exonuclease SbcCD ATPase subunit
MNKLRAYLPDVIFNNIVVVYTRCPYRELCQCETDTLPIPIPDENMFFMNNPAFNMPSSSIRKHINIYESVQKDWELCMQEFFKFLKKVDSLQTANIKKIITDVRDNRTTLQIILHEVQLKIRALQDVQISLEIAEQQINSGKLDQPRFQNFTTTKKVKKTILVDAAYHSTICRNCTHICHDNCGLTEIAEEGSNQFRNCYFFTGDNCRICKNKCSYTMHYHAKKAIKEVEESLSEVHEDIKRKYDSAVQGTQQAQQKLGSVQSSKQSVENAINAEIKRLEQASKNIMVNCSGFNLATN